ncbi:MAG TPA: lytic murein transglycosylase B [Rhodanobacteraceae bacterium]|nr:lytic murein transglycosylase B [Rhodanobacteraceae bacterium]
MLTRIFAALALALGLLSAACAAPAVHPGERAFASAVAKRHGLSEQRLLATLNAAHKQQSIIEAMERPAESKSWAEYRPIFMTPLRISAGIAFYKQHRALLEKAAATYGVPAQYIVAILGVETSYGVRTGSYKVLDALVTLAFYYPPRADYFRSELEKLLTMPANQLPGPVTEITGSYAGAMGWGQFMPSSIAAYARDGDGDGRIDLAGSLPDIVDSVAHYLSANGWRRGQPVAVPASAAADAKAVSTQRSKPEYTVAKLAARGYTPRQPVPGTTAATLLTLDGEHGDQHWLTFHNFEVITRYNRSPMYAMVVQQLAQAIADGAAGPTTASR